jgi:hypothetical protein
VDEWADAYEAAAPRGLVLSAARRRRGEGATSTASDCGDESDEEDVDERFHDDKPDNFFSVEIVWTGRFPFSASFDVSHARMLDSHKYVLPLVIRSFLGHLLCAGADKSNSGSVCLSLRAHQPLFI